MMWLRQSTAIDVSVGPFLDETDGKTVEGSLTITQPDIRLKKNGGAWAQKNAAQTLSHEENGWYEIALDTTDTNTLGSLLVAVHEAGALPVWREFMVVPAAVFDAIVSGTGNGVRSDVQAIAAGAITAAAIATGAIDADALAADTITAAKIAADAITSAKIATGAITAAKFAAGAIDAAAIADGAIDAGALAADALTAAKVASDVSDEIAAKILVTPSQKLVTDASGRVTVGAFAADVIDAASLAASAVAEIQSGLATAAAVAALPTAAQIRAEMDSSSVDLNAIISGLATALADLDDIQTRLPATLVGGRMDSSVGAMAADVLTAGALAADAVTEVVDALLKRDLDQVEATAAIHSLASAALKLVSRFKATTGQTFRTDGTTVHMTQTPVNDPVTPISELGAGA